MKELKESKLSMHTGKGGNWSLLFLIIAIMRKSPSNVCVSEAITAPVCNYFVRYIYQVKIESLFTNRFMCLSLNHTKTTATERFSPLKCVFLARDGHRVLLNNHDNRHRQWWCFSNLAVLKILKFYLFSRIVDY